jgi:hypothetical protein
VNTWQGLHPVEYLGRGVKYDLGANTGLVHEYVDSSVTNGKTYYYAVVSYDHGFDSLGVQLPPTESQSAILQDAISGTFTFDLNTVVVTPGPLAGGSRRAGLTENNSVRRVTGIATGSMRVKVLDDLAVPDNVTYTIDFDSVATKVLYNVKPEKTFSEKFISRDTAFVPLSRSNIVPSSVTVVNSSGATVPASSYRLDAEAGRIRGVSGGSLPRGQEFEIRYQYYVIFGSDRVNNEDDNPTFDGLKLLVSGEVLGIDSARSGWRVRNNTNLSVRLQRAQGLSAPFVPVRRDFEIRWNKTDTLANGKWAFPGDTLINNLGRKVVVCPFKIVNVTDTALFRGFVANAAPDSMWRPGREIIILNAAGAIQTHVGVVFSLPPSGQRILPTEGDVYVVRSTKPFTKGDKFVFTTIAVTFDPTKKDSLLNRIYAVPNPYVAFSGTEGPGSTSNLRGDNQLQFRNLPPRCTIRIYTMVGELVQTIVKDDNTSIARWNVLSNEGQRLAYGVYIYHVDAPGIGEKIGRLALIK